MEEQTFLIILDLSETLVDTKIITQTQILNAMIEAPAGVYPVSLQSGDQRVSSKRGYY